MIAQDMGEIRLIDVYDQVAQVTGYFLPRWDGALLLHKICQRHRWAVEDILFLRGYLLLT